jgi:NADH dehydrogenase
LAKVFITGGTGFLGSHLVQALQDEGHDLVVYSRTKTTGCTERVHYTNRLPPSFEDFQYIYHVAGVLGAKGIPEKVYLEAHHTLPLEILKRSGSNQHHVYISTAYVTQLERSSHEDYILTKIMGENVVKGLAQSYTIVRPGAIFGPGDKHHLPLFKWIRRLGFWFPIMGGKNKICPTSVKDVVYWITPEKLPSKSEVLTLAGEPVTIRDFLRSIAFYSHTGLPFIPFPTIAKKDFFGVQRIFTSDIKLQTQAEELALETVSWYATERWI